MLKSINKILKWCEDYPTEEKIILTESKSQGRQIVETINKLGYYYLNLDYKTLDEIATDSIRHIITSQEKIVPTEYILINLTKKVLQNLQLENKLGYYQNIKITNSIAKKFNNLIQELKLEGIINIPEQLTKDDKFKALNLIISTYNKELEINNYLDLGQVYNLALHNGDFDYGNEKYCIDIYNKKSKLQLQLIEKYSTKTLGINSKELISNSIDTLEKDRYRCFSGYGEINELTQILRIIKDENIPFEDIVIYHTDDKIYTQRMLQLSQKYNIPVSFGDGISINNSQQTNLIYKLIEWIESDYRDDVFSELLAYLKIENLSKSMIKRVLKDAKIGASKERYIKRLLNYKEELEKMKQGADDEYINSKIITTDTLIKYFKFIFEDAPEDITTYTDVIKWMKNIKNKSDSTNKFTMNADKHLDEIFEELKLINETSELNEILKSIKESISQKNIKVEREEPGHIYFVNYKKGYFTSRKYHFIVGLDNTKFPCKINENPILIDDDRIEINKYGYNLELAKDKPDEENTLMSNLISSRQGNSTISYSGFDLMDNKEVSPSYLFLKFARKVYCDNDITYDTLINHLGSMKGYIPGNLSSSLNQSEQWLYNYINNQNNIKREDVLSKYSTKDEYSVLENLDIAYKNKNDKTLTAFDGKVNIDNLKVLCNENEGISVSSLQTLATCPYKYFLQKVLGISKIEPKGIDKGSWLSSADYGNLVHEIMEEFGLKVIGENEGKIDKDKYEEIIKEIYTKHINKYHEKYGEFSTYSYNEKVEEIEKIYNWFMKTESPEKKIHDVEYCFGENGEEPVKLTLNLEVIEYKDKDTNKDIKQRHNVSKDIYIRGKVDRINKLEDKNYEILDYKTGSSSNFKNNDLGKGKHIQNVVYAMVLREKNKEEKLEDIDTSYVFLNEQKPKLNSFGLKTNNLKENEEECKQILFKLLDLYEKGVFIKYCSNGYMKPCTYCDYKYICKGELDLNKLRDKFEKESNYINKGELAFYV